MTVHVFTGPTLSGDVVVDRVGGAIVYPPVEHGDLLSLDVSTGDVVVIIDGYYHQRAPVRHKEVLQLLERGIAVVGCASMGALRAAELATYGMIGHGRVFQMYIDGEIDADDEVAVAHLPGDDFEVRNVPLVNVRFAVARAADADVISTEQADTVIEVARSLHYTERSWRRLRTAMAPTYGEEAAAAVVAFIADHPQFADLKRIDALDTLDNLAQIVRSADDPPELGHWHNPHVYEWLPEFEGQQDESGLISDAEMLRYQQIYRADFPALWYEFVIDEVSRRPEVTASAQDPAGIAEQVFAGVGAIEQVLSANNPFLTVEERLHLDESDAMVRTLVRSFVPPRGLYDMAARIPEPSDASEIRKRISAARRQNDQVLWRKRVRLVERLSNERLAQHLTTVWGIPADQEEVLHAHARDRGLPTILDAVGAVRPYFLLDDAEAGGPVADRWSVAK